MSNTAVHSNAFRKFCGTIVAAFFHFRASLPLYFLKLLPHLIFNPLVTHQVMKDSMKRLHTPLISVVIPSCTADVELRRCVDSVRVVCPDRRKCEVIVVLPTTEVDKARSLLPDESLVAERKPSIYGAMNDGVAASSGEYLYFLGKDDIVLPSFDTALKLLESKSPSCLFFDVFWGTSGIVSGYPSRLRIIRRNICHQGIIYSRKALLIHGYHYGPYLRKMLVQADHLLNIRLLWDRSHSFQFEYINLPLVWYSNTGFSSKNQDATFQKLHPLILKRYVGKWAMYILIIYRKIKYF